MIKVTKVDLHSLNVDRLNEEINAGWKPVAYVPAGAKLIVFLEGEIIPELDTGEQTYDTLKGSTCLGFTKAGDPCKGAPYKGTEYCVAHQDQG